MFIGFNATKQQKKQQFCNNFVAKHLCYVQQKNSLTKQNFGTIPKAIVKPFCFFKDSLRQKQQS